MKSALLPFLLFLQLGSVSFAQVSNNTILRAQLDEYANYNEVWGYDAGGQEYAILGTNTGTAFYNVTDPSNPRRVAFISGPQSTWRDMKTYSTYCYIVTEGGGGMQVVDLTNPENPTLVTTWGTSRFRNAHNLQIDTGTGIAYVVGTNNGMVVVDFASNPRSPSFIANWRTTYLHDIHVQNGLGHGCAINRGEYWVLDVSNPSNIRTLANVPTVDRAAHASWANANDTVCAMADETSNGHLTLWDIRDPSNPEQVGEYNARRGAIIHNVFFRGDIVHCSYYTEGYRAVDCSDPARPVEIAYYDTWPGASGGFNGNWGVYPYAPSGLVYVSDRSTGLYVIELDVPDVTHVPLQDTPDENGPYPVRVHAVASTGVQSAELRYTVNGGPEVVLPMTPTGTPDEYGADIPGLPAPSTVEYRILVRHGRGEIELGKELPYLFRVGIALQLYFEDFENGAPGWTHSATFGRDDWELGAPQGKAGDPPSAFSGNQVYGTDLGIGSADGEYSANSIMVLNSPLIQVPQLPNLFLRYRRWLSVERSEFDRALVYVNGLPIFLNARTFAQRDMQWETVEFPLSFLASQFSTMQFSFVLESDGSIESGGWNIDDFEISFLSDCFPPRRYGTASAGTQGLVPQIDSQSTPSVGNSSFALRGRDLLPNSLAFLLIAPLSAQISLPGITFLVDPGASIALPIPTSSAGEAQIGLPLPLDNALDGVTIFFQWVAVDSGAAAGLSASEGLEIKTCRFGL